MIADPTNIEPFPGLGEPFSAISHLAAALVFLFLAPRLIKRARGNNSHVAVVSMFAFACVLQLAMSGFSHQLVQGSLSGRILLRIDHAAIFFLIAATFTTIHVILFDGVLRWGFLSFIWAAAITGIVLKSIFFAHTPMWLGITLYLGLGWCGLFSGVFLWRQYGFRFMSPLLYGGIAYSLGVVFEIVTAALSTFQLVPGIIGGHEVFHFAVIAGMAIHWRFISSFAGTTSPSGREPSRS